MRVRHVSLMSAAPLPSEPVQRAEHYFTDRTFPASSLRAESSTMVRRFFIRAGYLDATVRATRMERAPDGSVDLQFEINRGEPYHYSGIEATGATVFAPAELIATLKLKPGESVNTMRMLQGLAAIRAKYVCRGYLRIQTVPVAMVDAGDHTERLVVGMREGARFRIAKLSAVGLDGALADVLLAQPILQPGEFFQPCEITQAARRVVSREQVLKTPFTFDFLFHPGDDTVDLFINRGFDFGYGEVGMGSLYRGRMNLN
jgi:outer membrane protein assembly factor BamA